jgi:iron(III) transport system permease protein
VTTPSVRRRTGLAVAALLTWLVGYPLLVTLAEALGLPAGLDLSAFRQFAERPDEWLALWQSLWISAASVLLAALIGVPLGFLFARNEFPGRRLLGSLVILPVALPPLVGVIAFLFLYGETGFLTRSIQWLLGLESAPWRLDGPGAILLVHAYSMYVFFYLFTRAALARFDASVLEAAAVLGARRWRTLRRVTLPLLWPALLGAGLLTFMTALGSFSAPYLFGGGFRVLPTQIVVSKLNGELAMARVETVMLAAVAFLGLWLVRRLDADRSTASGGTRGVAPGRRRLRSGGVRAAVTAVGWALALFLLLPHLTLIVISFVPPASWTTELLPPVFSGDNYRALVAAPERLRPVLNSLWMAVLATAVAVVLGALTARLSRTLEGRLGRVLELLLAVPWAIPGTVFAVALALTFSVSAPWMGRFVLVGTAWILPLAYVVRCLPVTGRAALVGLRQLDVRLEEAAASLGAGKVTTWLRVTLPLLKPALAAGASLAFITAFGDFVTSIVLYTYDTRPVSVEILSSLRLQDTGVAAVYGVFLMVVSAAIFMLWGRQENV